jgi:hypothetical protein
MVVNAIEQRALVAASSVARKHGLPCEQAEVAYAGSNVLVHLRPSPVVARVMTGTVVLHDDPEVWLNREVAVLGFLAPSGLAVAPSPLIAPGPYEAEGLWMTFWERVEDVGPTGLEEAERLGRALRSLHDALADFSGDLATLTDLQADIERLRRALRPSDTLSAEKIDSLGERLAALTDSVFDSSLPTQALHGDASLSNLLTTPTGLLWNDFEDTFCGPIHWDLAGYLISLEYAGAAAGFVGRALEGYGSVDRGELVPFAEAHRVYDEIWGLYDAQRRGRRPTHPPNR